MDGGSAIRGGEGVTGVSVPRSTWPFVVVASAIVVAILLAISVLTQRSQVPEPVVPVLAPPATTAPNPKPSPSASDALVVDAESIAYNRDTQTIDVVLMINDPAAAGATCRAVADDGTATAEATSEAMPDAGYARCGLLAVPAVDLHGSVIVRVSVGEVAGPDYAVEIP
jgi:hypothetical protein